MENTKAELKDTELEAVTGGTEPAEWSVPENGLPRPSRGTEPESNIPGWTPNTNEGSESEAPWKSEIPGVPEPGKYEIYGTAWGQD